MVRFDTDLGRELTPEELATLPPDEPMAVADRKAAMRDAVNARKDALENGVAPTPSGPCNCDPVSRNKINGAALSYVAQGSPEEFEIDWTMADDSDATLSGAELLSMGLSVGSHIAAVHARSRSLKAAIDDAADHAALDEIDITEGWPDA